jgi:hypothetical protein
LGEIRLSKTPSGRPGDFSITLHDRSKVSRMAGGMGARWRASRRMRMGEKGLVIALLLAGQRESRRS